MHNTIGGRERLPIQHERGCRERLLPNQSLRAQQVIPEEYRKYTLIEFGPQGDYYISSKLRKLFRETRDA